MTVHNEVAVGRLFILADSSLDEGRMFQGREAKANILPDVFQRFWADDPLACSRIEIGSAGIIGDLETPPIAAGNAVAKSPEVIRPDRHLVVAEEGISGGRAKEKYVLLGCPDEVADDSR